MSDWTLFSNYGHVLLFLALNPRARLRDVAEKVGITERAVQKIVHDLRHAGYLEIQKQGRCNRYRVNRRKHLRHSVESRLKLGQIVKLLQGSDHEKPSKEKAIVAKPKKQAKKEQAQAKESLESSQQSLDF